MGQNGRNGPKYLWKRLVLAAILAPGRKVTFYMKIMLFMIKSENMHNFMKIRKINEFLENLQKVHFYATQAGADISWKMVEFLNFH